MSHNSQTSHTRPNAAQSQNKIWRRIFLVVSMVGLLTVLWFIAQRILFRPTLLSITTAMRQGDEELAAKMTDQYVVQHPDDIEGWLLQAELAELDKNYRNASAAYAVVVSLRPNQLRYRHQLAKAQLQSAQFEAAELSYREILASHRADEIAQTEIQWMLFHQQRVRELEDFLEGCLADDPDNSKLLFHLLMSSQKPPNPLESLPVLEKIDSACPGQSTIVAGLAHCAWKTGDISHARELFDQLEYRSRTPHEFTLTMAEFELEQSHIDAAEQHLDSQNNNRSVDWTVDDRWWWLKSQILQHRRQYADALDAITAACRLRPRDLQYLQTRLALLQILGRVDEAACVQADLESRRTAIQEIYRIVSSGGLDQLSRTVAGELALHCRTLLKLQQADGWEQLKSKM